MTSKGLKVVCLAYSFFSLFSAPGCAVQSRVDYQLGEVILRSRIEGAFSGIEAAYASKNAELLASFLDKDFEGSGRFRSDAEKYFLSADNPHIHFIIDTVVTDKNGVTVRFHWLKRATISGTETNSQGSSNFVFKKYPEALKVVFIRGENPLF